MLDAMRFTITSRDLSPSPTTPRVRYHRLPDPPRSYLRRAWARRSPPPFLIPTPYGLLIRDTYYAPVWSAQEGGTVVATDEG